MSEEINSDLGKPELPPLDGEWEQVAQGGEAPQQQSAGMADSFAILAQTLFAFIATRKGEHWNLSEIESKNFGEAADKVAALYMDGQQLSPWVGLIMVGGMMIAPRVMIDSAIEKQKAKEQADNEQPAK